MYPEYPNTASRRIPAWGSTLASLALLLGLLESPLRAQDDITTAGAVARERLEREYAETFRREGLIPIFLPRGQVPGDVLAPGGEFLFRSDECFAGLAARETASRLPTIEVSWAAAARLALGAQGIGEAEARGKADDLVSVRFDDPRAQTVSRSELSRAAASERCPEVAGFLKNAASTTGADWIVVGEVLSARTIVRVRRAKGGQANLSFLRSLGERLGFKVRAEGSADLSRAEVAELSSPQSLPVALRPAVVRVTPELARQYRGPAAAEPTIEPFNPDDETHRAVIGDWLEKSFAVGATRNRERAPR